MMIARVWLVAITSVLLSGCFITPYKHPSGQPAARINVKAANSPFLCTKGKQYSLTAGQSGYTKIPANERVTIGSNFTASGYNVTYSCAPRISFEPKEGELYYQDFEIESNRCMAFVYREVDINPAGVDFEPSVGAAGDCSKR